MYVSDNKKAQLASLNAFLPLSYSFVCLRLFLPSFTLTFTLARSLSSLPKTRWQMKDTKLPLFLRAKSRPGRAHISQVVAPLKAHSLKQSRPPMIVRMLVRPLMESSISHPAEPKCHWLKPDHNLPN